MRNKIMGVVLATIMTLSGAVIPVTAGTVNGTNTTSRLSGQDRYQTSMAIAEAYNNAKCDNVILASGNDFPDALSASILSKKLNAPILLVATTVAASSEVFNYISAHVYNTGTIYIIGGTSVIGTDFETKLASMGYDNNKRLGGTNRYDTDMLIVNETNVSQGTPVFIASGENFPDALSVSSFSGSKQYPTLLVGANYLPNRTKDYIVNNKPSSIYIVGGVSVVSQDLQNKIKALVPKATIKRLAGSDRFETSGVVLDEFPVVPDTIYLADGFNFPDALAGSSLAAKTGGPILLIDPNSPELPPQIVSYLEGLYKNSCSPSVVSFGGIHAVPDSFVGDAINILTTGGTSQDTANLTREVFNGFFVNTDYSQPYKFLQDGEQTKTNPVIRSIAAGFNNNKDISTLHEIMTWLNNNLTSGNNADKFARTSAEIIGSHMFTGCTDLGLAFATLAREKGIPTVFLQTARIDWIDKLIHHQSSGIDGHILVEVLLSDNKWYLVDSTRGKLYLDYDKDNFSLPDGYYVFAKSIEVYDTGVLNEAQNFDNMMKLFANFDETKYVNPKYNYIDLFSLTQQKGGDFVPDDGSGNSVLNRSVILGSKEAVEAVTSRFFNGSVTVNEGEDYFTVDSESTAPVIVDLHVKGTPVSELILNYFPELDRNVADGTITKKSVNGQLRISIIANDENSLMQTIGGLPDNFLSQS